jgi:hypothetical protein
MRAAAWITALAGALAAASGGAARAQTAIATDTAPPDQEEKNPFRLGRSDFGFGLLAGGYSVGPVSGPGVGLHLDAGWNRKAWLLYGEYDFVSIGENQQDVSDPIRGLLHRFAAMGRYAFAEFGDGENIPLQGQFWVEAGAGREIIRWDEGGRLGRNDLAFGIGAELNVVTRRDTPDPNVFGIYYAFRLTVARAPDSDKIEMATCGGPCDEATLPSPYDLGLFFNVGLSWGR